MVLVVVVVAAGEVLVLAMQMVRVGDRRKGRRGLCCLLLLAGLGRRRGGQRVQAWTSV